MAGSACWVPPEALTTAERSIAKLIAWRTRTSENTSDVVFMLMYVRQYAGASTTRSETLGSCRRGSVEACRVPEMAFADRKSTRLNSSHVAISYAVFCL